MGGRRAREPKRQAGSSVLVDLNLCDVLLGLMGPTEMPETPARDSKPSEVASAHAGRDERA